MVFKAHPKVYGLGPIWTHLMIFLNAFPFCIVLYVSQHSFMSKKQKNLFATCNWNLSLKCAKRLNWSRKKRFLHCARETSLKWANKNGQVGCKVSANYGLSNTTLLCVCVYVYVFAVCDWQCDTIFPGFSVDAAPDGELTSKKLDRCISYPWHQAVGGEKMQNHAETDRDRLCMRASQCFGFALKYFFSKFLSS